ncbi:uncharacterized protein LOC105172164 [Sesamum indicum]|uniref:Uncharacterized protein LOC105172164 n=1 Tax=Sesamum indicum TaxID=4182 RepID=A0A8M8V9P8_SESIN|nr:uncharacterized protein LOC105172164 [Sesamum indicum]
MLKIVSHDRYAPFWVPMISAAVWNVQGLNLRDHQVSVIDLVYEYRLHLVGLLETRVAANTVSRIQLNMLPRWNWFIDYSGPSNRIWVACDDDWQGLDVVDVGSQHIQCCVLTRNLNHHVLLTIAYGANELGLQREFWQDLGHLAHVIDDSPWLVGGDFNIVLDMSEMCVTSGDICVAMEEFRTCLHDTSLLCLPMQGERFTWHNCSSDAKPLEAT